MFKQIKTKGVLLTSGLVLLAGLTTFVTEAGAGVEGVLSQEEIRVILEDAVQTKEELVYRTPEDHDHSHHDHTHDDLHTSHFEEEAVAVFAQATTPILFDVRNSATWSDVNTTLFPRESTATIIDVETGRSFRIKRTFGSNHADVEPLTSDDTITIYELWGGFNWDRRAVVVVVDNGNLVIPASMNGMPHAGRDNAPTLAVIDNRSGDFGRGQNLNAVFGNGMDGHICLHFDGSRTHGSGVVSDSHQQMVKKAQAYIEANF